MARLDFYKRFLQLSEDGEIVKEFTKSLLATNRTYDFFVGWDKVKKNIENFKIEIGILSTLSGSKNFEKDLTDILKEYPKTAAVLPLLIAVRDERLDVLEDIGSGRINSIDFSKGYTPEVIEFAKKAGIKDLFGSIKVLNDYLFGVEVGLDSNARKNRSGSFMENLIENEFAKMQKEISGIEIFPKASFRKVAESNGLHIPKELRDRIPDFVVRKGKKLITMEVNFYSGQGSKPQEIVDSYINRQSELKGDGWEFLWITDGDAWRGGQNQISKAIGKLDFVLNLSFVRRGFLRHIIESI